MRRSLTILLVLALMSIGAAAAAAQPAAPSSGNAVATQMDSGCIFFQETGHSLCGGFRAYWERYGGLAIFGYPITDEMIEDGMTVQYFERQRFEWHPGAWPERYDVLLGRLGAWLTMGREETAFQPVQNVPTQCTSYETGHSLCGGFRAYWNAYGGLAIFGYPISEEFVENGMTVQYFERARFEWHPGTWPARWDVQLGRLGAEVLGTRVFMTYMSGSSEVPPVSTSATGNALFFLSPDGSMLRYVVNVNDLQNVNMAHIHMGAADATGPVVAWLYPSAPPAMLKSGTTSGTLAAGTLQAADLVGPLQGQPLSALVDAMVNGMTYVNAHTTQYGSGEIRGQIHTQEFVANLNPGNEVPPASSSATGTAWFELSLDRSMLNYRVWVNDLRNIQMAHIHLAPPGVNGPVVVWLYPSAPPAQLIPGTTSGLLAQGTIKASNLVGLLAGQSIDALIGQFLAGTAYVNVHTEQYPGGEIRGQVMIPGGPSIGGTLSMGSDGSEHNH